MKLKGRYIVGSRGKWRGLFVDLEDAKRFAEGEALRYRSVAVVARRGQLRRFHFETAFPVRDRRDAEAAFSSPRGDADGGATAAYYEAQQLKIGLHGAAVFGGDGLLASGGDGGGGGDSS